MIEREGNDASSRRRPQRLTLVRLVWLVFFLLVVVLIATNLDEARQIASELRSARPSYLGAAAAVEVLFVLNLTLFYATTFWATGLRASVRRFVFITQASYFVNLVSKTGGIGGIAFYLQEARWSRQSAARVSAAYMAAYVLGYAAFVVVLIVALILLYLQGSLTEAEVIASLIITVIIVVVGAVPVAALSSRRALQRMYLLGARAANGVASRLGREEVVDLDSTRVAADELYEAITFVAKRPLKYLVPFLHALGIGVLSAALLYLMAHAVRADINVRQALSAYAISLLFSLVAITPSGLGFVEASLSVLLVSFGVSRNTAIAAALGYRFFAFWLPVALGAASLLVLQRIQRLPGER
ncbi:MAG: lysylphosphatidylglycerol synthase transmembrane domain-containing protein [Dehalococcoidia bacterium]|jgi:uncharacterized protein (TIRG00374 family)